MDLELRGRRAVITGGSGGIGLAVGRALAAEGADVVLAARGIDRLRRAVDEVTAIGGGRAVAVPVDTGDDQAVLRMVEDGIAAIGGIDILVNSAAEPSRGPLRDDRLEHELNIKVRGYLRCVRAVSPQMIEQGWGRIINIGGLAVRRTAGVTGSVRNAAVAAMTKNLADELGPHGINVTVVHPGVVRTKATAEMVLAQASARGIEPAEVERELAAGVSIGRLITAEEVASVVAFLASPKSVSLTGDPIVTSGGAPGWIFY